MRIAVSNIAWTADDEVEVGSLLRDVGVDALEAAPSRLFTDPATASARDIAQVDRRLTEGGLELVAFQSLLFTTPQAALFGDERARRAFVEQIGAMIRLAARMQVGRLVLGSPRNRRLAEGMTPQDAFAAAVPVFVDLAHLAEDSGTVLCIEPNPPVYGCDFITTPAEGAALVDAVNAPAFGLHLDVAGTVLAGADPVAAVEAFADRIRHVHVSAPDLAEIEEEVVPHAGIGHALRRTGYRGLVSIEMRAARSGENAGRVRRAVSVARRHYGS